LDRIGLLDSINESALSIDIGRKGQNTNGMEHEGRVSYHNGLALALETFKKVQECRYNNMPKDAFHYMCAGHQTRIENILKAPGISLAEKELLKQRYDNLVKAQSIYYEKQKNVLSSNPP